MYFVAMASAGGQARPRLRLLVGLPDGSPVDLQVPEGGRSCALEVMEPGELVWRARHRSREAMWDRAFVEWIDRFRYTSVELLAMRFGVAVQRT